VEYQTQKHSVGQTAEHINVKADGTQASSYHTVLKGYKDEQEGRRTAEQVTDLSYSYLDA
jgi:hypothetical protein